MCERHLPLWSVRHPIPMQQRQLLVERHLLQYQVRALFRAERGIHPRPLRFLSSDDTRCEDDYGCSEGEKKVITTMVSLHLCPSHAYSAANMKSGSNSYSQAVLVWSDREQCTWNRRITKSILFSA